MSINIVTVRQLLAKEFPPTESILGSDLLDKQGVLLITGPQKIGKSLFAGQLGLSIADQKPLFDFAAGGGRYRVLNLQAEVAEKRTQDRFRKQVTGFSEGAQERVFNACVFSAVKLDRPESVKELTTVIDEYNPDVLVIDPLVNFHTGDENDAGDIAKVTSALDTFRGKGIAVVVVHHHGKGSRSQNNVGHKARGSSALAGWYDSHLSLEWADEKNRIVKLRFELRHSETPEDLVIKLNPENLLFEVQSDEASQLSLVVSTVEELGHATADQVATHCNHARQWASLWLNRAVDKGLLVRQGSKPVIYRLPPAGNEIRLDVSAPQGFVVSTNTSTDSQAEAQ